MNGDEPQFPTVTYAIDDNDQLIDVDDAWVEFAEENGADRSLRPDRVIGQSLWNFIREETLQSIYRQLIAAVRSNRRTIEFDFRCDSPDYRRYMRMSMISRSDGVVQFRSQMRKVEGRNVGVAVAAAFGGARHILRCSVCNLYQVPSGNWVEIASAVGEGDLLNDNRRPKLLWAVCPDCKDRLVATLS